jgi:hypothetical protein
VTCSHITHVSECSIAVINVKSSFLAKVYLVTKSEPSDMSDEEFNVQKRTNPILAVIPYTSRFTLYQLPSPPSTSLQTALTSALLAPLPETSSLHVAGRGFLTITRTQEEWSIMIDSNHPSGLCKEIDEAMRETGKGIKDGPFACLRVKGPMDLCRFMPRSRHL